ncbi:hypothetical protein Tco_1512747, partial [Tanacetum coccineum]
LSEQLQQECDSVVQQRHSAKELSERSSRSLSPNTKERSVQPAFEQRRKWRFGYIGSLIAIGVWLVSARKIICYRGIFSCGSAGIQSLLRAVDLTKGHCLPNKRSLLVGFHCFVGKTLGGVFLVKGH